MGVESKRLRGVGEAQAAAVGAERPRQPNQLPQAARRKKVEGEQGAKIGPRIVRVEHPELTATVDTGFPAAPPDGYAEIATQLDCGVVRGRENLGAGIDPESFDFLDGDAAAGMAGGLQYQKVDPAPA